ncbi:hypothetical protein KV697_11825 [Sphingomonas sanguinis]|uniref:alpha/beta hydrolase n=1 Tax=Sphingomonas sanguinis TaxID=33051 RepID=UPI001C58E759|nr:alpha/beta hydrolase-fold protein [Sphingomonas sanguinis]QXT34500.1 hypothetical protein KV697_11825 [Sphingomonas sanguinis]
MLALSLVLVAAAQTPSGPVQSPPEMFSRVAACRDAGSPIAEPCALPLSVSSADAVARLGSESRRWWVEGDRLTMIARPDVERWAMLCCSVQTALEPIPGTDLAGVTVRVPRIDEAILSIATFPAKDEHRDVRRGVLAPPAPERIAPPPARLIRRMIASRWLGETRGITIYLPPVIDRARRLPVFYLADNLAEKFATQFEADVRAHRSPPAILVGIDAAAPRQAGCTGMACDRRGPEYKIDFNTDGDTPTSAFGRHLRFVTLEVIPLIEKDYPASRRATDRIIGGSSNGAHWALATAGLHPELFGKVLALSSSGQAAKALGAKLGRVRMFGTAGLFEPGYLVNTRDTVEAARSAGATVRFDTLVAGHDQLAWDVAFARGAPWLLDRP